MYPNSKVAILRIAAQSLLSAYNVLGTKYMLLLFEFTYVAYSSPPL